MPTIIRLENLLTKVKMKDFWLKEDADFTPWVIDNLQEISDLTGINLGIPMMQQRVGCRYKADVIAVDMNAENEMVVIENQITDFNHDHLGKGLTYMTNVENVYTVIWISESFTPEHCNAIKTLNSISNEKYKFYAIKVNTYKLNGQYIYQLEVVVEPDYMKKRCSGYASSSLIFPCNYWNDFSSKLSKAVLNRFRILNGRSYTFISFGSGINRFSIHASFSVQKKISEVRVVTTENSVYDKLKIFFTDAYNNNRIPEMFKEDIGARNTDYLYLRWIKSFDVDQFELLDWHVDLFNKICELADDFVALP